MVQSTAMYRISLVMAAVVIFALAAIGCSGRPSVFPNKDKSLRKSSAEFAADAAKRHPYPADAEPGGEANARVQVGYSMNRLDVVNFSDKPWVDVDLWVNQKYVVHIPTMPTNKLRSINFQMLFDDKGHYFPIGNMKIRIEKVEVRRDGKLYDIPVRLAD